MSELKRLHNRLHTLREGIAGDSFRNVVWLCTEALELLNIAKVVDPEIVPDLEKLKCGLVTLINEDVDNRVELDQIACKILNEQEDRVRKER